jgi:PleD family two-component response regulator
VAHYGEGVFAMVLKHTDIDSAKRASERLFDLVSCSNFFIAEQEIQLRIAIGVAEINASEGIEQILVGTLNAMEAADNDPKLRFMVCNA